MMKSIAVVFAFGLLTAQSSFAQDAQRPRLIVRDNVLKRAGEQFDRLDANKDGALDAAEQTAFIEAEVAKLRARLTARFAEADASKVGRITRDEFIVARGRWFDAVDANADGILDQAELRAYNSGRAQKAREGAKP